MDRYLAVLLMTLNTYLPYYSEIPFLSIYMREMKTWECKNNYYGQISGSFVNDIKLILTLLPRNPIPRYLYERNENICSQKYLINNVHWSLIHSCPKLKTTQCSSTTELVNKMYYIHIVEYYSAIKMNKLLKHSMWINLKIFTLKS